MRVLGSLRCSASHSVLTSTSGCAYWETVSLIESRGYGASTEALKWRIRASRSCAKMFVDAARNRVEAHWLRNKRESSDRVATFLFRNDCGQKNNRHVRQGGIGTDLLRYF